MLEQIMAETPVRTMPHSLASNAQSNIQEAMQEIARTEAGTSDGYNSEDIEPEYRPILPPPPAVPLEAFPPSVAALLQEASEAFTVPLQIPVVCLLGLLSCLVGGSRLISLRPSWREPGNIWIATVAASGIGKTPCAAAFFDPIKQVEYKAFREWQEAYAKYEREAEPGRKKRARVKKGASRSDNPEPPKRRQAYVDDATVEAIGEILSENPRGIMWRRDELSGLIADLDKYSSGGNGGGGTRARLLSSYDGQEWKTSRVSNLARNLYIPHAFVGIFGGIQPAMLSKVFEVGNTGVDEASGFLQRFLLIRAEREKPGYWTESYFSDESKNLLSSIVDVLWAWDIEYDLNGQALEMVVTASQPAKALFVEWFDNIAREEFLSRNAALLSKLKGQAQRICLLLHCLDAALAGDDGMAPVTEDCMRRALLLADWAKMHQEQCWTFFQPDGKIKRTDPIERAVMAVVVEEAAKIEADGWKISNERLFGLVEAKLAMPGLSGRKIGRAAAGLGLGQCKVDRNSKGRSVTKELMDAFRSIDRYDRYDRNHYRSMDKIAVDMKFETTASDRTDTQPEAAGSYSVDMRSLAVDARSLADSKESFAAQDHRSLRSLRSNDLGNNFEFDSIDPADLNEDKVEI